MYNAAQLGLLSENAEVSDSKVKIIKITPPKPKMKGLLIPDSKMSSAEKLRMIMGGGITKKSSEFLEGDVKEIVKQLINFFKEQKVISS